MAEDSAKRLWNLSEKEDTTGYPFHNTFFVQANFGKTDEVEDANFSFKNKSYVDALLQKLRVKEHTLLKKGQVKERATERVISKYVTQKGDIITHRETQKNK